VLPEFPKFKELEIGDLEQIKPFLEISPPNICELSPSNLFIWSDFDRPQLTIINNNLCIFINPLNESPYFLQPLGITNLPETLNIGFSHCAKISRVTKDFLALLPHHRYKTVELRSHSDYLYEVKTLAELKGRKFDGKRNHLKNFHKRHPNYQYLPLTCDLKNDCLAVFEAWFAARAESRYFPRLAHTAQKAALEKAFKYGDRLGLIGGAISLNHQLAGFMIGSRLNKETLAAHFQYGRPDISGIFPALIWETCNRTFANYKYINLEQDLGIPGLRQSKLSYHPLKLVEKFELTLI
jgi:hypothetical protein